MRSVVTTLMCLISLPVIFLYGFYLTIEFYSYFHAGLFTAPLYEQLPFFTIQRILMNLGGVVAWLGLAVMTYSWCKNQKLDRKWPILSTILACIGIYACFTSISMPNIFKAYILLSLPIVVWALYLSKWHLSNA